MSSITVRHDLRDRFGPARDQGGRETGHQERANGVGVTHNCSPVPVSNNARTPVNAQTNFLPSLLIARDSAILPETEAFLSLSLRRIHRAPCLRLNRLTVPSVGASVARIPWDIATQLLCKLAGPISIVRRNRAVLISQSLTYRPDRSARRPLSISSPRQVSTGTVSPSYCCVLTSKRRRVVHSMPERTSQMW
jgi:hypothetical protein